MAAAHGGGPLNGGQAVLRLPQVAEAGREVDQGVGQPAVHGDGFLDGVPNLSPPT